DDTPESKFFMNIMAAVAAFERDRICYRTSRGIKKRQANGEHFGKVPIGYQRVNGKGTELVPFEKERVAVETARRMRQNGLTSVEIANRLDRGGRFRGKYWKARTVRKMIAKTHNWEKEDGE
ncbi:MAG TPA: hypothetical protein ENH62_08340, partial [Marinobacter sp.]|nr:hypothetical protein [Marinobacter sp.]